MESDPGIICFQHCQKDTKVFALKFPDVCPICQKNLTNTELIIPPFRIPYPFRDASKEPNKFVIRPSIGEFLDNYENSSYLHIGVTDSKGWVYEFGLKGIERTDGQTWYQCLPISIIENITTSQKLHWDRTLNEVFNQTQWTADRYNFENHNCYTFVLSFLRSLQMQELLPYLTDKITFCQQFIFSQAQVAAKYLSLYRQVKSKLIVVQ